MSETKRIPRREMTARKFYFKETDDVLGLFTQTPEQAQSCMKSSVLWDLPHPAPKEPDKKAVKLYDAATGQPTDALAAKKPAEEDEYPCLRAMAYGFLLCMALYFLAQCIVGM